MTHIVSESCIRCKYTDCVDVCPVDCFREGPNMLVIDPDECLDCAVCIPECPVNAIYAEEDVPADQMQFIKLNVELSAAAGWKSITKRKTSTQSVYLQRMHDSETIWVMGHFYKFIFQANCCVARCSESSCTQVHSGVLRSLRLALHPENLNF